MAEEVELVVRDGETGSVGLAERAEGIRRPRRRRADADGREDVGAARLPGGARLLDVEHGDAQVAVVRQGDADQEAQALVGEEALPLDLGGGLAQIGRGSWTGR